MPANARPDSHIAAGVWCFAGQEDKFPGWDAAETGFPLPADPFADAEAIRAAARSANAEVLRLCRVFGDRQFPDNFLINALGPFLLLATHMLLERQKRVQDLLELYGKENLRVETAPDLAFSFRDSLDFMLRGVQDIHFNHHVYSRILESAAPANWELGNAASVFPRDQSPQDKPRQNPAPRNSHPVRRLRDFLRRALLYLPFPPCKGFGPCESLFLSLAVLLNKRDKANAGLDFSLYASDPPQWIFPAEQMIRRCLPPALAQCLEKGPGQYHFPSSPPEKINPPPRGMSKLLAYIHSCGLIPPPLRGMSPVYSQDDAYCLRLGALRAKGCRLFCIQHGANYGNLKSLGGLPFEYSQHAFFTWGWKDQPGAPANARPLPHPALAALAGAHRENEAAQENAASRENVASQKNAASLILVGTEMSSFSYRLKSRPQSGALPAYRRAKITFLRTVAAAAPPGLNLFYRPYFKVAGGLEDAAYVLAETPGVSLCSGDLTQRMLGCRLLVLDHYGTTLHCALVANVPTLAFWRREDWGMDERSEESLDALSKAGILLTGPEEAAAKVLSIRDRIPDWWREPAVQAARRLWLRRFADIGDPDHPPGRGEVLRVWFKALREC